MRIKCSDGRVYDTSDDLDFDERNLIQKLIILESVGASREKFEAVMTAGGSPLAPGRPAAQNPSAVGRIAADLARRLEARTSGDPPHPAVSLTPFQDTYLGGGVKGETDDAGRVWLVFINGHDQEVARLEAPGADPREAVQDWLTRAKGDPAQLERAREAGVDPVWPA
jgi:hypothetical protein